MLLKIKNWLIKKLGGYTKAEYNDLSRFPIKKFEFIPPPETKNIVTVDADGTFDCCFGPPPREWMEKQLIYAITEQMKPYVRFEEHFDRRNMKITVRAYVKVVDGNG